MFEPVARLRQGDAGDDHRRPGPDRRSNSACRIRCTCTATTSARPGNVTTTLETMKLLEGNRAHMAHLQFHAYGGDDWHTMRSRGGHARRVFQRPSQPHRRRRRDPVRQRRDDHRRRSLAAFALPAHRPQMGQPRRRERDRLRHRPLHVQGKQPGQRRAVGRRTGAAAAHQRPVADLPDHRPSQRRLFLALSGNHPSADERRLPRENASRRCRPRRWSGSSWRTWTASTRCRRSPSSRRPGPRGPSGCRRRDTWASAPTRT